MKNGNSKHKMALVTGGAGFLGSHLCRSLLRDGHHVVCLDNFQSGSRTNIQSLLSSSRFTLIHQDVIDPIEWKVDEVYNMACVASPRLYQQAPLKTLRTSVVGTDNMLRLIARCNGRLFHASTSEIYGDPHQHPQPEEYFGNVNPIGERACYDEGKRCAETLCMDYRRVHGIVLKIARIFNTYGPRMQVNDGRVVSNFIVQALLGRPITIYGNGAQTRSFCYVDDLIQGIRTLLSSPPEVVGPINLGNPEELTVAALAERIIALTGSSSTIKHLPLPADDPVKRRPDISRARKLLNWEPQVSLDEGLRHTIAYFDEVLSEKGSIQELAPPDTARSALL